MTLPFATMVFASTALAGPPKALWDTSDRSLMIASGPCEPGSKQLCAIVVGIMDESLMRYAKDLCELPILWNLTETAPGNWSGGTLLDPETQKTYPVTARTGADALIVRGEGNVTLKWPRATRPPRGCQW